MPDEIDGDDRLGVTRRTGLLFNSKLAVSTSASEGNYGLNESMYVDAAMSYDDLKQVQSAAQLVATSSSGKSQKSELVVNGACRHRRYSIIGNDPSFKQ